MLTFTYVLAQLKACGLYKFHFRRPLETVSDSLFFLQNAWTDRTRIVLHKALNIKNSLQQSQFIILQNEENFYYVTFILLRVNNLLRYVCSFAKL